MRKVQLRVQFEEQPFAMQLATVQHRQDAVVNSRVGLRGGDHAGLVLQGAPLVHRMEKREILAHVEPLRQVQPGCVAADAEQGLRRKRTIEVHSRAGAQADLAEPEQRAGIFHQPGFETDVAADTPAHEGVQRQAHLHADVRAGAPVRSVLLLVTQCGRIVTRIVCATRGLRLAARRVGGGVLHRVALQQKVESMLGRRQMQLGAAGQAALPRASRLHQLGPVEFEHAVVAFLEMALAPEKAIDVAGQVNETARNIILCFIDAGLDQRRCGRRFRRQSHDRKTECRAQTEQQIRARLVRSLLGVHDVIIQKSRRVPA